jgi:hypothetical protein
MKRTGFQKLDLIKYIMVVGSVFLYHLDSLLCTAASRGR